MAEGRDQVPEEDSGSSSHRASQWSDSSPPDDSFLFETKYIVLSFLHHLSRKRPDAFITSQASLSSSSSDPRARLYAYRWKAASLPSTPPHKLRSRRVKKRGLAEQNQQSKSEENLVKKKPPRPRSAKKSKCDQCNKTQSEGKNASFAKGKSSTSLQQLRPQLARSLSRSCDDIHYLRTVSSSTNDTEYQSDADDELDTSIESAHSFNSAFLWSKAFKIRQVSRDLANVSHRLSIVVSESEHEGDHLPAEQVQDDEELPSDHAEPELLLGIRDLASCLSPGLPHTQHQVLDVSSIALQIDEHLSPQVFTFPPRPGQGAVVPSGPSEDVPVSVHGLEDVVTETSHPAKETISPSTHLQRSHPPPFSPAEHLAYETDPLHQDLAQPESEEQLQRLHSTEFAWNADLASSFPTAPEASTPMLDEQQDTSEYCMCDTIVAASADFSREPDADEVMSKDSLDAVDGKEYGQSEEVTGDEQMEDTMDAGEVTGAAGNDLDLEGQAGGAWGGAATGDRMRLFLDLAMPPPEQLMATFQEELEDEMMTLESKMEDMLRSQHLSRGWTPQVPLTPQTEVARILASIGDEIKMENEQRLNSAVSSLFSSGGLLSYAGFLDSARHLVNCHLPGWRQVVLLMIYSQQVAFESLRFGKQGLGDLTDYTVAMLADLAADFIINQGGWASITRMDGGFTSSTSFSDLDIRGDIHHARRPRHSGVRSPRHPRQADLSASAHSLVLRNSTGNLPGLESPTLAAVRGMSRYASLSHLDWPDRFTQSCRDLSSRSHHRHRAGQQSLSRSSRDFPRSDHVLDAGRTGGGSRGAGWAEPHDSPAAQHLNNNNESVPQNNNNGSVPQNSVEQSLTDSNSRKESSSGEATQEESGGFITSQKLILSTAVLAAGMGLALILWKKGIS